MEQEKIKYRKILFRLVTSLILAILIWYTINDSSSNLVLRTISNIPVSINNTDVLAQKGLTFNKDVEYFVNLEIRGTETNLNRIKVDELSAEIVLLDIDNAGVHDLPIVIKGLDNTVILEETYPSSIQLDITAITSTEITPTIITQGKPLDGYSIISSETDETVTVEGPSSSVDAIDSLIGVAYVDGLNSGSYQYVEVKAYDKDGNILEDVVVNPSEVEAFIDIGIEKTVEIEIPEILNAPTGEYIVTEVNVSPATVKIAGAADIVDTVTSIATTPVTLTDEQRDYSILLETTLVIPNGVALIGSNGTVEVSIQIEKTS